MNGENKDSLFKFELPDSKVEHKIENKNHELSFLVPFEANEQEAITYYVKGIYNKSMLKGEIINSIAISESNGTYLQAYNATPDSNKKITLKLENIEEELSCIKVLVKGTSNAINLYALYDVVSVGKLNCSNNGYHIDGKNETKPSGKNETKNDTKPSGKNDTKNDTKPSGKNDTKNDTKPSGKNDTKNDTKPSGKNDTKNDTKPSGKNDTKNDTKPSGKNDTKNDTKPSGKNDTKNDTKPSGKSENGTSKDTKPPSGKPNESGAKTDSKSSTKTTDGDNKLVLWIILGVGGGLASIIIILLICVCAFNLKNKNLLDQVNSVSFAGDRNGGANLINDDDKNILK
jgi:hypothetical protein